MKIGIKTSIHSFLLALFSFIALGLSSNSSQAAQIDLNSLLGEEEELLKVDDAFVLQAEILDNTVLVKFEIADGYYMYRERFGFKSDNATLGEPLIPDGKEKDDPYLGQTEVYYHFIEIAVPYSNATNPLTLSIDFQGCAEDRLCYPPTTREVTLEVPASTLALANSGTASINSDAKDAATASKDGKEAFVSEQQSLMEDLEEKGVFWNFFKFILIGLGLTFTPCVFPMIPIISGIIAGQGKDLTTRKAFGLALSYTQAMAIVYTIFGVLVALAGQSLSGYLQSPGFVIGAAIVFVLLSLSMFGFYELQLPSSLQAKLAEKSNSQKTGSYIGSAIMGAISALIVSPCVTVPLIAILLIIAQTGDILLGAVSLYGLGIGMGIPLIIIAVTEGRFLPKAGNWMNAIKAAFGVAMLAVALYLIKHLLPNSIYMYGWSLLALIPGYYLFKNQLPNVGWRNLFAGLGLVLMIYGALLVIGGAQGNRNLLQPLGQSYSMMTTEYSQMAEGPAQMKPQGTLTDSSKPHLQFERIKTLSQLEQRVAEANAQGKTVMVDFFAVWCAACYEFEALVFTDPAVHAALGNTVLLQADVTANDPQDIQLMNAFNILGLPSILFFDLEGNELTQYRANGFEEADVFVRRIEAAFGL
ncbi:protein-disulfide reductase DsbD [Kangiella aquimarina]|uniref:Thiol:disulfide interchange protein DsbD n=1 Tax=Kangiella aquimarina TaxID=261965 RepID=A0ABZ0X4A2_9GAMM|nr:protein-disulfide reductase DsbD [Kangiella aquimarina]WQG85426.1 protein-disulfide reductase DsbD [Kangiella aquimarina]